MPSWPTLLIRGRGLRDFRAAVSRSSFTQGKALAF